MRERGVARRDFILEALHEVGKVFLIGGIGTTSSGEGFEESITIICEQQKDKRGEHHSTFKVERVHCFGETFSS